MGEGEKMIGDFKKAEYQHILSIMNGTGPRCELCSSIRKKLESRIAEMPDEPPEFFEMEEP
jgi:hypothetical protein